ncbi:hypothetical protein [Candidatus Thiosymbion oneisti]|uniref:hypothetical protein n=1 Tax=Candidatus Thiosymbion oneisti TaxID=589554 RepID=UPI000B7CD883|nr:hypothetical protein [Candidatus Thiosymbion oneisti]
MKPPNCDHCLRPTQTSRIAKELLEQRRPINLIGKPGQGRGRLLEDLTRIDPDALWLRADLKEHRYSFAGLLKTLWDQTSLDGDPPPTLGGLVDKLADDQRPVCLLLHHLDAILNNPDLGKGFDVAFLDGLNALKNRGISLLCVTERAHNRYLMMARSGERRVSTLTLEPEALRPLSQAEIRSELDRCLPDLDENDLDLLADAVLRHSWPLSFLDYVRKQLQDGDAAEQAFKEQLNRWKKEFKSQSRGCIFCLGGVIALRQRVICWYRAIGLDRIKFPLGGFFKQLIKRRPAGED